MLLYYRRPYFELFTSDAPYYTIPLQDVANKSNASIRNALPLDPMRHIPEPWGNISQMVDANYFDTSTMRGIMNAYRNGRQIRFIDEMICETPNKSTAFREMGTFLSANNLTLPNTLTFQQPEELYIMFFADVPPYITVEFILCNNLRPAADISKISPHIVLPNQPDKYTQEYRSQTKLLNKGGETK